MRRPRIAFSRIIETLAARGAVKGTIWYWPALAFVLAAGFWARLHGPDASGEMRTAAHLRRVALGLGERRVPDRDRFLDHPNAAEAPFAPLHDELLAGDAADAFRWPPPIAGDDSFDPFPAYVTRWNWRFGLLAVLAVAWAASSFARGRGALLAAGLLAVAPLAVGQSAFRGLDPLALVTLLAAVASALLLRCLRAERLLDVLASALGAGAALGLAAACSPLAAIPFLAGVLALGYRAWRGSVEGRAHALRAGLLFCGVAALLAHGPLTESVFGGVERAPATLFGAYPAAAGQLMLGCAMPFLLGYLLSGERQGRGRATQSAILAIALAAILWFLPRTLDPLFAVVAAWVEHREALALALADHRPLFAQPFGGLLALTPVALAYPWAARALVRSALDAERVFLLAFGLIAVAATLVVARCGGLALVPIALTLAGALDPRDEPAAKPAPVPDWVPLALAVVLALQWTFSHLSFSARSWEGNWIRGGLRHVASSSGAGDAWTHPDRIAPTAVVATPSCSGMVEYHSRLPMVASVFGALDREDSMREVARALLAEDPGELVRLLRSRGAEWVAVGARDLREARRLAAFAGFDVSEDEARALTRKSVLAKLALAPETGGFAPIPGFLRSWSASYEVESGVGPAGPVFSVWRLDEGPASERSDHSGAELRAR